MFRSSVRSSGIAADRVHGCGVAPAVIHAVVFLAVVVTGGCQRELFNNAILRSPHETGSVIGQHRTADSRWGAGASRRSTITVVRLGFDVLRVELPPESAGDARKVWNHLDNLRLDPDQIAWFARNGLRVGVAPAEAWPAIETILGSARSELAKEQYFARQGEALGLTMSNVDEGESIFVYGHGGRVAGKTFQGGDKLITLDYAAHGGSRGSVEVRLGFEIRDNLGIMTWRRIEGVVREVPALERHIFDVPKATLTLAPGESLVIGLSDEGDGVYLLGNRFLTAERDGRRFETLLFITPQSFQGEVVQSMDKSGDG